MLGHLFVTMIKEEWRIHSTMFGNAGFALFPLMLTAFAWAGSFALPVFLTLMPADRVALIVHLLFAMLGVMVGSFGIMGREFMNRRFGQASLIAYSSRSLPVSDRLIFLAFFLKDVVYYFLLWVIPAVAGFALATPMLGIDPSVVLRLAGTLTLSFLLGLSVVFFLSTLYAHSRPLLAAGLAGGGGLAWAVSNALGCGLVECLPSYLIYQGAGGGVLAGSLLLVVLLTAVSVRFATFEYPSREKRFSNAFLRLPQIPLVSPGTHFVMKDGLDLRRSEGGLGKILFSFLLPVGLIWVFLTVLIRFIPGIHPLIVFAVLLGVISSTMYNWLTEFDAFTSYTFLPVEVETVIRGKLTSYTILNGISLSVLLIAAAVTGDPGAILPAIVAFISVSVYALGVTVYLTGLYPNIMLYHARTFGCYLIALSPVLLGMIFVSAIAPAFTLTSVIFIPVGTLLLKKSLHRWSGWDMPHF